MNQKTNKTKSAGGIVLSPIPLYTRFRSTSNGEDDPSELKIMHMFLFTTSQERLQSKDPANPEAAWFSPDQVSMKLTHPKDREYFDSIQSEIG